MLDLSGLKVGDPVVIIYGGGYGLPQYTRSEVVAVTKGGNYKLKGFSEIWDKNGSQRGAGSWSRTWFERFDQKKWDENAAAHQERKDRHKLTQANFGALPIETVRELLAIIEKALPEKPKEE